MQVEFVPGGKDHGWYFKDGHGCVLMAHGEPVPLLVAHEIAGRLSSGWMPWHGGLIPAGAHGQRVDIQFRDGEIFQNRPAGDFSWHSFDIEGDIVFWRVSPLPAVPGEHDEVVEIHGWHDIEALMHPRPVEWPDKERADRDPTAIMGGVVAHEDGGCATPVLTDEAQPAGKRWLTLSMIALVFSVATAIGSFVFALLAIGHGDTTSALLATILVALFIREVRHDLAAVQEVSHG